MNILIVDDSDYTIKLIQVFLKEYNYTIHVAATGKDAIRLYSKNNYALVFMDLNLPGIDGIAVTRQIRVCDARKKFVPIIAITAYSDREIQTACFSAGMNDFLTKPIQKQQVEAIIRKYSNTIIPCKFLIPWYKEGTVCKTCTVDNSNIFIPDTILTR